jgi:hypothetical protein
MNFRGWFTIRVAILVLALENPPNPLYKGEINASPSRINLRDSNPVRGEMFIETGTTKHISSSVGVTREIAARNTCRSHGAWWICGLSYAINISLLTEFRT